jgi:hypothetical protein
MLTTATVYRVMAKVRDDYGNESFIKFGPLRKTLQSAIKAADAHDGYAIDCSTGQVAYQAESALAHTPRQRKGQAQAQPQPQPFLKSERKAFFVQQAQAQIWPSLAC